ncbi:MAG: T9SS type A sorting domain-containing protein [Bacteroidales bacterium]|nr:T9SS type A sorting domain-containing protein [Bacteroidales bacterium]
MRFPLIYGQITFEKTFGGANDDIAFSVQQTSDSGYIIVGYTESYGNGGDIYLIKTAPNGDLLWTKCYGGSLGEIAYSVQETDDNGFIIAGISNSFSSTIHRVYLIKSDSYGDTLWTKIYGRGGAKSVQQISDGGYIIVGYTPGFEKDDYDVYIIRTDSNGDTLWTKTYGNNADNRANSIRQTKDGGFIIAGQTTRSGENYKIKKGYLIKIDADGDTIWTNTDIDGILTSVQQTGDGGCIVTGYKGSIPNIDAYLVKTDANGKLTWIKTYGLSDWAYAESVQITNDGGYIFTGSIDIPGENFNVYLVKTDYTGKLIWAKDFGGRGRNKAFSVQQTNDGGYIMVGFTKEFGSDYDVYLIKTVDIRVHSIVDTNLAMKTHLFPNPTNGLVFMQYPENYEISIELINCGGAIISQMSNQKGNTTIDLSSYPPGIYILKIKSENEVEIRKIIKK